MAGVPEDSPAQSRVRSNKAIAMPFVFLPLAGFYISLLAKKVIVSRS